VKRFKLEDDDTSSVVEGGSCQVLTSVDVAVAGTGKIESYFWFY
jgi:hypothetical protein